MKQAGQDFSVCCDTILETETVNKPAETVTDLESLPEGIKLDTIRWQYTVDMTFDPDTANDLIMFSEDFKQVQTPQIWWCDNIPHKFNAYSYVLGKKGFSEGRFYQEEVLRSSQRVNVWEENIYHLTPGMESGS